MKNGAGAMLFLSCLLLTWFTTPTEASIDCFKCVSKSGDNPACDDPFHNNHSLAMLESPCMGGRKGRDGLFPATSCIKLAGVYDDTGMTITVRGCALDSGTVTTDTEIIRMSHCGRFYYDDRYVHGCLQSCNDADACNAGHTTSTSPNWLHLIALVLVIYRVSYTFSRTFRMPKAINKKEKNAFKQDQDAWQRLMQETSGIKEPLQPTKNGDGSEDSPKNDQEAPGEWMEHGAEIEQFKQPPVIKKMKVENFSLADDFIKTWKQMFSEAKKKEGEQRKRCMTRVADQLAELIRKEEAEAAASEEQERQQWCAAVHKQNQQTVQGNRQKLQLIKQTIAAYEKQWLENVEAEERERAGAWRSNSERRLAPCSRSCSKTVVDAAPRPSRRLWL